jgi:hypothetical protein
MPSLYFICQCQQYYSKVAKHTEILWNIPICQCIKVYIITQRGVAALVYVYLDNFYIEQRPEYRENKE